MGRHNYDYGSKSFINDEEFSLYTKISYEIDDVLKRAKGNAETESQAIKDDDEVNQEVTTQMYLIEIMLDSMLIHLGYHLKGEIAEAVITEFIQLRKEVYEYNEEWIAFRKTFI
ncbi:hypothetical protein MM221_05595 [Salipaludibacillus sp. LMS25]|uniref:hypothetical protein n=1 Tax=Salipaludibacillus sp. LMS25 TaxID=2924031 RepID=UPI0020D04C95|nr:hypothetical protein [Salipaludibacillus sp. LMS25]UTR16034.1 hypothetical protein MM221_05595 [Salipaludibacillus sp. LMS25]